MILVFCATSIAPVKVSAEVDPCDEQYLRNLGVVALACEPEDVCTTGTSGPTTTTPLAGDDNITKIFNYFLPKGYKDFQIAGMLGNMKSESGIAPQTLQGRPGKVTPVESLTPAQLAAPKLGYGLVQWTPIRKMLDPVKAAGKDPNLLEAQLDFLWDQLEGRTPSPEKKAGDHLKGTGDVASATLSFETKYERHSGGPQPQRIRDAEKILNDARAKGLTSSPVTNTPASTSGLTKAYVLGDSITVLAKDHYQKLFAGKNITPTISAVGGRSWTYKGDPKVSVGTTGNGLQAVTIDKAAIAEAGAIIIALGTNDGLSHNPVDEIYDKFRSINPSAPIYWINTAGTNAKYSLPFVVAFNAKLKEMQAAGKITLIDWANEVDPGGDGTHDKTKLLSDGIHPNQQGFQKLIALVDKVISSNSGGTTVSGDCTCKLTAGSTQPATPPTGNIPAVGSQTTVVLDPGHSPGNKQEIDPASGLITKESGGGPNEMQSMWEATQKIKTKLEAVGYKVVLTKNSMDEQIGHLTRAQRADAANAAIAVSMHYDGSQNFGVPNPGYGVTPQEVGRFRENLSDGKRKTFTNSAVAQLSQQYSKVMAEERTKVGDPQNVVALSGSFPKDRGLPAWGDIANVQLLSNTPWVYNEDGAKGFNSEIYATGIANGIIKAVPNGTATTGAPNCDDSGGSGSGAVGLSAKTLEYAWPDYHPKGWVQMMPLYEAAVKEARAKGSYVGGIRYPGVDCGGFVTLLMINSGYEPNYNTAGKGGYTAIQKKWLDENWKSLGAVKSTSELLPGDVAMKPGHTFAFVGTIPGFNSQIASASLDGRAPMAGKESVTGSGVVWYRKK